MTLPPSTHFSHSIPHSIIFTLSSPDLSHFSFTVFSSCLATDSIYVDTPTKPSTPFPRFSFELNSPGTISTTFSLLLPLYSPDRFLLILKQYYVDSPPATGISLFHSFFPLTSPTDFSRYTPIHFNVLKRGKSFFCTPPSFSCQILSSVLNDKNLYYRQGGTKEALSDK